MSRNTLVAIVCLGVQLVLVGAPATAATTSITVTGQLDAYYDPESQLPFAAPPSGAPYVLSFTYDDAATVDNNPLPNRGSYDAISSVSLTIGDWSAGSFQYSGISISNDYPDPFNGTNDIWSAYFSNGDPSSLQHLLIFQFRDLNGSAFTSEAMAPIPAFPSDTYEWVTMNFLAIKDFRTVAEAFANVDDVAIVPIPAGSWLLGSAVTALVCMRRKSRLRS